MSRFTCTSPAILRRSLLAGIGALALAPLGGHAAERLRIPDLIDADGIATERGRALVGTAVSLRGYVGVATTPGPDALMLTDVPSGPCQLCGAVHGSAGVLLALGVSPPDVPALQLVEVEGEIALGPGGEVRLVGARVAAV